MLSAAAHGAPSFDNFDEAFMDQDTASYTDYRYHVSLPDYLNAIGERYRMALPLAAGAAFLNLLRRTTSHESVWARRPSQLLFPPSFLERYAHFSENSAWDASIIDMWYCTQGWANPENGNQWHTLEEVGDPEDEDGDEEEATLNPQDKKRLKSLLETLRVQFALPKWQRVYVNHRKRTVQRQNEYPGWLIAIALHRQRGWISTTFNERRMSDPASRKHFPVY